MVPLEILLRGPGDFIVGEHSERLAVQRIVVAAVLELLADPAAYLVTQVPRQEDIGFDLICNLADQGTGLLSFQNHYAVSVKSVGVDPKIELEPPPSKKDDATYEDHFRWLFNLELPLLVAMVDKKKDKLSLYSTLSAWFLFYPMRQLVEVQRRLENGERPPPLPSELKRGMSKESATYAALSL